jgi:hypothetical protein
VSDTPQTDERTYSADCLGKTLVVNADWAKLLERENAALKQVSGELCEKCGWAMKFPAELCRCELERENAALRETVEALGDANDRLTIEITELRKDRLFK